MVCVCVWQLLVKSGADLFAENEERETPCDCAERQQHKELAHSLESQMVFSQDPGAQDIEAEYAALDRREVRITQPHPNLIPSLSQPYCTSHLHILSFSRVSWIAP